MSIIWKERKRLTFFALPFTFTKYTLTEEKILIDMGLLTSKQEEVRLYRVLDLSLTRTLGQKIFGLGTITCKTADKTMPILELKNIKKSNEVKEMLSTMVEEQRMNKHVSSREYMANDDFDDTTDDDLGVED